MGFAGRHVNIDLNINAVHQSTVPATLPTRRDLVARMISLDHTDCWQTWMYALTEYVGASYFLLVKWQPFQEQKLDSVVSSDCPFDLVKCMAFGGMGQGDIGSLQRSGALFRPFFYTLPENANPPSCIDRRYCALTFDVERVRIGLILLFPKGHIILQERLWEVGLLAAYQANIFKNCDIRLDKDFELTGREIDCLIWIAEGKTSEEIALILGISRNTVNNYIASVMRKTATKTRSNAIAYAVRNNIV
ncbi:putative GerE/LuxR family transcriptional regulator [Liberibacter crescens BT-1]|uniref:Putative GerE/LuxR family transcriptional regulator n=1 Tax=Liberibacter crescens (strain BT-1) TaxID=1215343 RepID=L0ET93_LIBCB|nr:helix-turn-helix transcriptional regulator [Liberibacter crescens]AGA64172.1 putative GerE/LuxR family transcriptional regulator [Liberibacter crescens BT-1]AMC12435.1 LuxR family transcriptional regulator [Liberibacter crescens]